MSETIGQRLTKVEQELQLLKQQARSDSLKPGWISSITGSFKDDPESDEILRPGKEIREDDQPENDE